MILLGINFPKTSNHAMQLRKNLKSRDAVTYFGQTVSNDKRSRYILRIVYYSL